MREKKAQCVASVCKISLQQTFFRIVKNGVAVPFGLIEFYTDAVHLTITESIKQEMYERTAPSTVQG